MSFNQMCSISADEDDNTVDVDTSCFIGAAPCNPTFQKRIVLAQDDLKMYKGDVKQYVESLVPGIYTVTVSNRSVLPVKTLSFGVEVFCTCLLPSTTAANPVPDNNETATATSASLTPQYGDDRVIFYRITTSRVRTLDRFNVRVCVEHDKIDAKLTVVLRANMKLGIKRCYYDIEIVQVDEMPRDEKSSNLRYSRFLPTKRPSQDSSAADSGDDTDDDVPEEFLDPISLEILKDPVVLTDGFTYERSQIELWLTKHDTSPMTNEPLKNRDMVPNMVLRSQIAQWQQHRKHAIENYTNKLSSETPSPSHGILQNG